MTTLLMILGGCLIGLGVGLMSTDRTELKKRNPKKPWKPKKKNWFVRQGELLDDDYYW